MQKRELGRTGIKIAPLALGTNVFGWTVTEKTGFAILDRFAESGCTLIDTADFYSRWVPGNEGGESESLLGRWLKKSGKRSQIVIATKVGLDMGAGGKGLSRKHILKSVDESLSRLQCDYIDLYQSHTDDPSTPLEESLSAYAALKEAGKIRAIGASNYSASRLQEALEISKKENLPRYETLQPEYNLCKRDYEKALAPLFNTQGISVIPYYPLASGFLSGKYRTIQDLQKSVRGPGVEKYLNQRGLKILEALDGIASAHQCKTAAIALAWLMAKKEIAAPIVSVSSLAQWEELLPALEIQLSKEEISALDAASAASDP
jgi:aryl-alcohol dehydrogenase-like predicted oxidoreductase